MYTSKTQMKVLLKVKWKEGNMRERSKDGYVTNCKNGMLNRGLIVKRATQDQRFSQNILLQNRNIEGVNLPRTHPHAHAQILDNTHVENEML